MHSPIAAHARRVEIGGETAWIWSTELGYSVLQWPFQIDLENSLRSGAPGFTIDWRSHSPRTSGMEGGLFECGEGHLDETTFLKRACSIVASLRER